MYLFYNLEKDWASISNIRALTRYFMKLSKLLLRSEKRKQRKRWEIVDAICVYVREWEKEEQE